MSSTDKRAAGASYCALLMVVIFEGVAIIAALVAITGTFWLGAPSFFSRPTLPPRFADPDLLPPLVRRRPARHREGFCAPRRQERGALARVLHQPRDAQPARRQHDPRGGHGLFRDFRSLHRRGAGRPRRRRDR